MTNVSQRTFADAMSHRAQPWSRQSKTIAPQDVTLAGSHGGFWMKLSGKCFCGAVEIEVSGAPEAMGYCHCSSCRSWSGGPVNAFSLWKPEAVRITAGAEHVATFQKTALSQRKYCAKCGGHLMTDH